MTIDEPRARLPALQLQDQASHAEPQSIADHAHDRAVCLPLDESLGEFFSGLRSSAENLDVHERQRIVQFLVKEILIGDDTIMICHSIPDPAKPPGNDQTPSEPRGNGSNRESHLLRSEDDHRTLRHSPQVAPLFSSFHGAGVQPFGNEPENPLVRDAVFENPDHPLPKRAIEGLSKTSVRARPHARNIMIRARRACVTTADRIVPVAAASETHKEPPP